MAPIHNIWEGVVWEESISEGTAEGPLSSRSLTHWPTPLCTMNGLQKSLPMADRHLKPGSSITAAGATIACTLTVTDTKSWVNWASIAVWSLAELASTPETGSDSFFDATFAASALATTISAWTTTVPTTGWAGQVPYSAWLPPPWQE